MTQMEKVYKYMQEHGGITPMDAFSMKITRLAAVIFDLKKEGAEIETESVRFKSEDGKVKYFTRYSIKK